MCDVGDGKVLLRMTEIVVVVKDELKGYDVRGGFEGGSEEGGGGGRDV